MAEEHPDELAPVGRPSSTASHLTVSEGEFARVALFTGRPLYWTANRVSHTDRVRRVMRLLRWTMELPGVWLGLSPSGLGAIVRSIYSVRGANLPPALDDLLDDVGAGGDALVQWHGDAEIWGPHLHEIVSWLENSAVQSGYVWLSPSQLAWYIEAVERSLLSYGTYGIEPSKLLALLNRYRCVLFGRFEGGAIWEHLGSLVASSPRQENTMALLAANKADGQVATEADRLGVYWSWQLLDFASVGNIVYTPLLALWSDWPASHRWAPVRPEGYRMRPPLSSERAAEVLEEVFWQQLEPYFTAARLACDLGWSEQTFFNREMLHPVFYYAQPIAKPSQPEDYLLNRSGSIAPLVDKCLASDDPHSQEVTWGLLGGMLTVLRREMIRSTSCQSWYLVLPLDSETATDAQLDGALGAVADSLTFVEFTIGHQARDIATDLDSLRNRRALWAGVLDTVNETTARGLDLLATLSRRGVKRVEDALAHLYMLLQRLFLDVETVNSNATGVRIRFDGYVDGVEDYIRRRITFSPLTHASVVSLREGLRNAYPYASLRQPVLSTARGMGELRNGLERTIESLNSVLVHNAANSRDRAGSWGDPSSLLISLLGLLLSAEQVVAGTKSVGGILPASLEQFSQPDVAAHILVDVVSLVLMVAFLAYALNWALQHVPNRPPRFIALVQRLRTLLEAAEHNISVAMGQQASPNLGLDAVAPPATSTSGRHHRARKPPMTSADVWAHIDEIDDEATRLMSTLWDRLDQELERTPTRPLQEWLWRTRVLEYHINLFCLAPDIIPLPRALCVYRYKGIQFYSDSPISDWDFEASLTAIGFSSQLAHRLDRWLSSPDNTQAIRQMSVREFADALKQAGVTVDPHRRSPAQWQGVVQGRKSAGR